MSRIITVGLDAALAFAPHAKGEHSCTVISLVGSSLAAKNINIDVIAKSNIKIPVLIDRNHMAVVAEAQHDAFKLEKV